MTRLTPLVKGIITGILMIAVSMAIFLSDASEISSVGYLIYVLYAGGIAWTLIEFAKLYPDRRTFGSLFNQGFRCFIVVTLIMVTFTAIMFSTHPEWAVKAAELYRADLVKEGNKTPEMINEIVETAKKQFTLTNIATAIFGYLITGALMTALGSAFLIRRK